MVRLKWLIAISCAGLVASATPAIAQTGTAQTPFRPYMFLGPGGSSGGATFHLGGGFDLVSPIGLGAGVEMGYVGPFPNGFDYGIGLVSFNAVYDVPARSNSRTAPFVTGGYTTTAFRGEQTNLLNAGGGIHYRLRDGLALRLELRDHFQPRDGVQLWSARIGLSWR